MIVLDASAAVDWLLQTPAGQRIEKRIYSRNETLHAPHLLDLEVTAKHWLYRDCNVLPDQFPRSAGCGWGAVAINHRKKKFGYAFGWGSESTARRLALERALLHAPARPSGRPADEPPESQTEGDAFLSSTNNLTLAGMLALSGVAAESMVQDVGWTMMDIGKRIERGLALTALLRATLTTVRSAGAEQTITESTLVACESSVSYRRRNLGAVSVSAVADLVLLDAENPRSLVYQIERLRADLKALPGSPGSSRPERLVDEIGTRLRRLDPADLEEVTPDGRRAELADLLDGLHTDLRDLSGVITATHLSLPGGMQPLWGPDERRVMP
jgi:hypothetical protein